MCKDIGGAYFVCPGWWGMLDRELKDMYDIDPRLSGVMVEEKYGHTRIKYDECSDSKRDLLYMHEESIHRISGETCELCGKRGKICEEDGWVSCRCERCQNATHTERRQIQRDTAAEYQTALGKIAAYLPEGIELTEREAAAIRYGVQQRGELDSIMNRIIRRHGS